MGTDKETYIQQSFMDRVVRGRGNIPTPRLHSTTYGSSYKLKQVCVTDRSNPGHFEAVNKITISKRGYRTICDHRYLNIRYINGYQLVPAMKARELYNYAGVLEEARFTNNGMYTHGVHFTITGHCASPPSAHV